MIHRAFTIERQGDPSLHSTWWLRAGKAHAGSRPNSDPQCMAGSCVSTRPQDSCYFIHQALPLH